MPINSTLDVVVQQDDLIVLGGPTTIDVSVGIGPKGDRGSQIYTGAVNPNSLSTSSFASQYGEEPEYKDLFVRNDSGNYYGTFYSYTAIPGGDQWQQILNITDSVNTFFNENNYIISASAGGTGVNNGSKTLTFLGNINFANTYNVTFNSSGNSSIMLPTSGSVAVLQNKLSNFAITTPTELASVISGTTGSGSLVFNTSPTFLSSIRTTSSTFDLVNTNVTTLNIGSSASAISIGSATGTTTINNGLTVTGLINGSLIGNISGNSATATALQTSRAINLGGSLSGSASFNGTSDITINGTVTDASKLTTARIITISGAVSGSASFDGTSDINIVVA